MAAIMIQGTSSSVGKTLLCMGLCRIFARRGYSVVPFKAVSTAPFSAEVSGGVISRAVALEALAARVSAQVCMNPVYAKSIDPNTFELYGCGKVSQRLSRRELMAKAEDIKAIVSASYEELSAQYDIVMIEGSGSAADFLQCGSLANMGIAQIAKAPVLLVGDIDRGGVFAALAGTLSLLSASDKARVKGLIINKFRGDVALLTSGLDMIKDITGVGVMGVVPYARLAIEEEDLLGDGDAEKTYSDRLRESEMEKWADILEKALDMEAVYSLLRL